VLPFTNMSGDPEQEYFCDGMAEDIITALSRFRSLFVIARNSSFTYKGRAVDVRQVGRELGVRYVLEGSVRKAANRVRLTAQLVEVANGNHVWADRYEGMVEDVFDLQDRTTEAVVGILEPAILAAEIERARSKRPDSLAAYDHYLRAQALSPLFSREANREMLNHCLKAIALDPRYAPAIALAALAHLQNYAQGWSGDEASDRAEGLRLAEQALLADRSDSFILAVAGHSVAWFARDLGRAIAYLDEATTVNTNHTHALWASGIVRLRAGQVDRALEHLNRALRLSPRDLRSFIVFAAQAEAHHLRGDLGEAVAVARRAVQHNPNYLSGWRILAASAARLGQEIVARQAAERLMVLNPAFTVGGFVRRYPYSAPEMWQSYFDGLRQAGVPE
jgi:adenylate cyclase